MKPRRIVVAGTLASDPYAGMAWMHMQITEGLRRLGHDVIYFETTSAWPYDPVRQMRVCDADYALPYLKKVVARFGLEDRWAYRQSYSDKAWFGMERQRAESFLASADLVLNVAGSTRFAEEGLKTGRLIYFGTDPVQHEIGYFNGVEEIVSLVDEHDECVTYGENIGNPDCPIPPLSNLTARTRQPVLLDQWRCGPPSRPEFTTVCNWKQAGHDIVYKGETYYWSKHLEFMKFIDLPRRIETPIELAMGLDSLGDEDRNLLQTNGWKLADAHDFTTDPFPYKDYILASRGEFTVAKDQNVRLRSGWFSERTASYLAAGRPAITQDTGFGVALPTGEGLFAFRDFSDILTAFEAVESDYPRHSQAALDIAHEYFDAEKVLAKLLEDLGC